MEAQNPQVTHPVPRALKNTGRFESQSCKPQSAEQRETAETPVFDTYTCEAGKSLGDACEGTGKRIIGKDDK